MRQYPHVVKMRCIPARVARCWTDSASSISNLYSVFDFASAAVDIDKLDAFVAGLFCAHFNFQWTIIEAEIREREKERERERTTQIQ
jgi:hypothetical protein